MLFADAESFLQVYRQEWRDCLLIDIRMPGMDSLALQKRLVVGSCRIPIIVMTGHGKVKSTREAYSQLANDWEPWSVPIDLPPWTVAAILDDTMPGDAILFDMVVALAVLWK